MTDERGADALACLQQDHAQLQQDQAELQQRLTSALSRITQLQFTVAHELRAPLRHVGAFVQVIREDHGAQLPADVLAHLSTIEEAARQMNTILDAQQRA